MTVIKWKPIEDLPGDWSDLASSGLAAIGAIWREQSARLKRNDDFVNFNERMAREWAIETGILERIYTIDRGITQILIEKGLEASLIPHGCSDKPAEEVVSILNDHQEALEGLFDFVSQRRSLSSSYIKQLHQVMTRNQNTVVAINGLGRMVETSLRRGEWKQLPNNPSRLSNGEEVHEYCPPEHVAAEMDRLIEMHQRHEEQGAPPEIEAAWLHHRFTQIHPFQDGNGRIARALASLIFIRSGWFPLVVNREQREEYLRASETSDAGDLKPLVELFARIQKKSFIRALSISETVLREREPYRDIIAAAGEKLKTRQKESARDQLKVFEISESLEAAALKKLEEVADELNRQLQQIDNNYRAAAERGDAEKDFWFRRQIVELALKNDYFADTRAYRAWVRLSIKEERQVSLIFSFHGLGREFVGILAASAFLLFRDKSENRESTEEGPYQACDEIFQFSYNENPEEVRKRFQQWIDKSVVIGLYHWRKQL